MKALSIFRKKKDPISTDLKARIAKNREAILDVAAQNIKGARQCPLLLANKCLGQFCEFFLEFKSIDNDTGIEGAPYFRCAFVQFPLLQIEINSSLLTLIKEIQELKILLKEEKKNE